MMRAACGRVRLLLSLATLFCTSLVQASVVMTGTRVIYPAAAKEQTLQFQNPDPHPNVVQVWLDDGDAEATPDAAQSPFLALPQIFRVEPNAGQMVRLMLADASGLPQDRESVFYLNFSQLPVQKKEDQTANQLLIMLTSRLKVFYRPKGIAVNAPDNLAQQLQLSWRDGALHVHNPSAYHVNVESANLLLRQNETVPLTVTTQMIAPFSDVVWWPEAVKASVQDLSVQLVVVNDFGGKVVEQLKVL